MFDNPQINEQIALKTIGFLWIVSIATMIYNSKKKNVIGKKVFLKSFLVAYLISVIVFISNDGLSNIFGLIFVALMPSFALCSIIYYIAMGYRLIKGKQTKSN